jgi:hypothetical protein
VALVCERTIPTQPSEIANKISRDNLTIFEIIPRRKIMTIPMYIFLRSDKEYKDHLCGLVVRVLGYRSGGPVSILGTTRKKVVGLERDPLSLVSTTEELLDRKVAAPV